MGNYVNFGLGIAATSTARWRPPRQGLPDRSQVARADAHPLEAPDRRLAYRPCEQRTHGGGQQPDQAGEACRLRVHVVPELPNQVTALRRQAQLGAALDGQTPVISEVPPILLWRAEDFMCGVRRSSWKPLIGRLPSNA